MTCVHTAFEDSTLTYGGLVWAKPKHGIGQGNGGGPPIWAVISSTVLDTLRTKGFGFKLISPISTQLASFVGCSSLDDTDQVQSDGSSTEETASKLQEAVDCWEGGIKVTGGALGPNKSHWYLVYFIWSGGRWSYAPTTHTPATLYMNDIHSVRKAVRRIQVDQAKETLGVWIAPDGNTNKQHKQLLEKSIAWADQMQTGVIRKDETW